MLDLISCHLLPHVHLPRLDGESVCGVKERNARQRMKKKEIDTSRQLNYLNYLMSSAVITLMFKSTKVERF